MPLVGFGATPQLFHGRPIQRTKSTRAQAAKRPDAHMTRLNVLRMVDAMKSAGLPADLSLTAGAYVCNDLYFALLDRGLTVGGEGVFVHVPTEDVVSAEDAAKGLEICLRTALEG